MQNQNFGIMDEGYFVPRSEILSWLNDLLKINLSKIQELGSGSVYCQIIDVIYPGKISLPKVNWKAKNDYQFLNNFKILQSAFEKLNIKRYIQVQKLSKAKYQDNLEFIQWMKRYYDVNCGQRGNGYAAEERRGGAKVDFSFADKVVIPKSYNATGQVIPKKSSASKERKKQENHPSSLAVKQQTKRIITPNADKKDSNRFKSPSGEKRQAPIDNKQTQKDIKKQSHLPPVKKQKTEHKQNKQDVQQLKRPSKSHNQQYEKFRKTIRDLQVKIEMITEIAVSEDDSELKIKLIQEVLSISQQRSKYKVSETAWQIRTQSIQTQQNQNKLTNSRSDKNTIRSTINKISSMIQKSRKKQKEIHIKGMLKKMMRYFE